MDKKRVLYVGGFQLPDKNAAAHRVVSVAKALRELNYEVVFLDVDSERTAEGLSERHACFGFDVYSQRRPQGTSQWIQYVTAPLNVETVLNQHDDWAAVIAYNYPAIALFRLKLLCRSRKIRLIADCTEWYQADQIKSFHDLAVAMDSCIRMRIVHKHLDGMIAISTWLEKYYRKHLPTIILPPMIDAADEKWKKNRRAEVSETVRFIYAGSPGTQKDMLNVAIRAIGKSDVSACFEVVGISEEQAIQKYPAESDLIRRMISENRLSFHQRMSHSDALELLQTADYSVFYREVNRVTTAGFPTKFVESVSCGVPVITTPTSDLARYMTDGKNGYLLDIASFEPAFMELITSGRIRKKPIVESDRFDYRGYVEQIQSFLADHVLK